MGLSVPLYFCQFIIVRSALGYYCWVLDTHIRQSGIALPTSSINWDIFILFTVA